MKYFTTKFKLASLADRLWQLRRDCSNSWRRLLYLAAASMWLLGSNRLSLPRVHPYVCMCPSLQSCSHQGLSATTGYCKSSESMSFLQ